jgi:hypothetical protein
MVIAAVMIALALGNMASQYKVHDRSKEYIALDYGVNFLNSLEENAIIFTNGDNDTFPLGTPRRLPIHTLIRLPCSRARISSPLLPVPRPSKRQWTTKISISRASERTSPLPIYLCSIPPGISDRSEIMKGILFNIDDSLLDEMYRMQISQELRISAEGANTLRWNLPSSTAKQPNGVLTNVVYRISDLAVMQIIKE